MSTPKGTISKVTGEVEEGLGKLTGNREQELHGKAKQVQGAGAGGPGRHPGCRPGAQGQGQGQGQGLTRWPAHDRRPASRSRRRPAEARAAWASGDPDGRVAIAAWNGTLDSTKATGVRALGRSVTLGVVGLPSGRLGSLRRARRGADPLPRRVRAAHDRQPPQAPLLGHGDARTARRGGACERDRRRRCGFARRLAWRPGWSTRRATSGARYGARVGVDPGAASSRLDRSRA